MREIKFRAWAGDYWLYFSLEQLILGSAENFKEYNLKNWCQFTGLKDKKGKEIYEGDIVRYRHTLDLKYEPMLAEVQFEKEYARFNLLGWFGVFSKGLAEIIEMEVIGNKFENPELLEETK